jgi:hypothetical protein
MAHADDIGRYEGPPCEICRVSQFVGTCTHRPRKLPEMPPIILSEAGMKALADLLEKPVELTPALKKLIDESNKVEERP